MTPRNPSAPATLSLHEWMRSPVRQVPVMAMLIVCNVLLYLVMAWTGRALWHMTPGIPLQWGANFGPATQGGEWWRLLSAVFVHFSLIHIAVNMWALWDVGRMMERVLGRWRFVVLYLGAGVVGNLVSLAMHGQPRVSGGASGAIFGLYGALLAFLWRERRSIDPFDFRWLFVGALVFSALMLLLGFFLPGIDNAAHGGGLLAGALLGGLLRRPLDLPDSGYVGPSRRWTVALTLAMIVTLLAGISPPPYRYEEELETRAAIQRFMREDQAISARWGALLVDRRGMSFDQLADALHSEVAASYERSFNELAAVQASPAVPSRPTLLKLQAYAATRKEAALQAAQELRSRARRQ
jgi:rhomboid protease GluP